MKKYKLNAVFPDQTTANIEELSVFQTATQICLWLSKLDNLPVKLEIETTLPVADLDNPDSKLTFKKEILRGKKIGNCTYSLGCPYCKARLEIRLLSSDNPYGQDCPKCKKTMMIRPAEIINDMRI